MIASSNGSGRADVRPFPDSVVGWIPSSPSVVSDRKQQTTSIADTTGLTATEGGERGLQGEGGGAGGQGVGEGGGALHLVGGEGRDDEVIGLRHVGGRPPPEPRQLCRVRPECFLRGFDLKKKAVRKHNGRLGSSFEDGI